MKHYIGPPTPCTAQLMSKASPAQHVRLCFDSGIATLLTLNRPERKNPPTFAFMPSCATCFAH
jgi:hypothetical protein